VNVVPVSVIGATLSNGMARRRRAPAPHARASSGFDRESEFELYFLGT
jgi:hypothetical protein